MTENTHAETVQHQEQAAKTPEVKANIDFNKLVQHVDLSVTAVKQVLTGIPIVKRGPKSGFMRAHKEASISFQCVWHSNAADIDEKVIILADELVPYAPADLVCLTTFIPIVTREGALMSWYIKHPTAGRNATEWYTSKLEVLEAAYTQWVRMESGTDRYHFNVAPGISAEPKWPEGFDAQKHFELALKKYAAESSNDPTLRQLRGEE